MRRIVAALRAGNEWVTPRRMMVFDVICAAVVLIFTWTQSDSDAEHAWWTAIAITLLVLGALGVLMDDRPRRAAERKSKEE